jgi:hypothetical protein
VLVVEFDMVPANWILASHFVRFSDKVAMYAIQDNTDGITGKS